MMLKLHNVKMQSLNHFGVFWLFSGFREVFWSFYGFWGYFGNFKIWEYFGHF